jgi:tripartite-type tricarboxylate transporter receptor subunit TctC
MFPQRLPLAALLLALAATTALPAAAADYFAGKTIEFTVGADVGGGFDVYARTIAKHLPRHLPGNPTIVVKNMPGAGSGKAATYMATAAPKDGTAIGALMPGAVIGPLLEDREKPQYDPTKLIYLATADSVTRVCTSFITSKIKTFEDAQQQKGAMGASAAGGSSRDYVNLVRKAAGAQFDLVSGYKGSAEMALAIERGEVDGMCGWDWPSLKAQKPDWIRDNKVNILAQFSLEPDPELTKRGVPEIWQFIKKEEDRKPVELVLSQQVFGRPYVAPPGTPPEAVKLLRDAFIATLKDKEFLAEADKAKLAVNALDGAKVQEVVSSIYASAPAVVERAKELIRD